MFSSIAINCLQCAGWKPQRRVQTASYKNAFLNEGFDFPSEIQTFLQRYGGLVISYRMRNNTVDVLEFTADYAVVGMSDGLDETKEITQTSSLYPIGTYMNRTTILLMSREGKVFGYSDTYISHIADSGEQAIENILTGKPFTILQSEME